MSGFENSTDETLLKLQENLRKGIIRVAESLTDGSFDKMGPKGEASPAISGQLTLLLLQDVSLELAKRGKPSVALSLHNTMQAVTDDTRPPRDGTT